MLPSGWVDQGPLAVGAMAEVRRVRRGDERGVVKRIRGDQVDNPVYVALLEVEVEALVRLDRVPEVVRRLDHGVGWLVLEEARPLEAAPDPWPVLVAVGRALVAAHAVGVVHRDPKRSNVLRVDRGPILADFGAARVDGRSDPAPGLGSPEAFAPERLAGEPATPATDRFAYGVLAWELITGHPPWTGTRWVDHLRRAELPRVVAQPKVEDWLRALLSSEPSERPEPLPPETGRIG